MTNFKKTSLQNIEVCTLKVIIKHKDAIVIVNEHNSKIYKIWIAMMKSQKQMLIALTSSNGLQTLLHKTVYLNIY